MKYEVYQINLSREQINEVNSSKDGYPEFYAKYMNTTFRPTAESIVAAKDMYSKVAVIEADGFEEVFEIGNIFEGYEDVIERIAPMHSVSVGDVIVREDGVTKFVAPIGFQSVTL